MKLPSQNGLKTLRPLKQKISGDAKNTLLLWSSGIRNGKLNMKTPSLNGRKPLNKLTQRTVGGVKNTLPPSSNGTLTALPTKNMLQNILLNLRPITNHRSQMRLNIIAT